MKPSRHTDSARARCPHQQGFVLAVSLVFLVVLTLLALAMFRSFGLQERIAGNTRDKERAFEAAQSALQFGEWWLSQGTGGSTGTVCNSVVNANTAGAMHLCSNALTTPSTPPWAARFEYVPPNMTVAGGGGLAASGDINYQGKPALYISYLGLSPDGLAQLYQVSAYGYGGNADTAAVVQSTYEMKTGVKDLGGL